MNAFIVEDEIHAQKELKRILAKVAPDCQIMGVADGIQATVEFLNKNEPDLIFMDIQLSDGQSFEIFNQIEVKCPVIFTTAYDAYALQAFKANGIDYLLKPIEPEAIEKSLAKFKMLQASDNAGERMIMEAEKLRRLVQSTGHPFKTRFMTTIGDRIKFLSEEEVAYFQADDEVVYLITHDKKKFIINYTLENLEPLVDPSKFFRINRRYLAAIDSIGDIHKHFNSRLKLNLQPVPTEEVLVSRARVQAFLQWIGQ